MLTKRIIPCLDIKNGRTVKGVNFVDLIDAGNPVELAKKYSETGADELVFLDISATEERRSTLLNLVREVAEAINIPFTVGGGINSVEDVIQRIPINKSVKAINNVCTFIICLFTKLNNASSFSQLKYFEKTE